MRLPLSLMLFVATGALFILQLIPVTGIFLMFLLAPLWSVPLVNLGFAGIAYEVFARPLARAWLLLPILWFGGYAGFAAGDHVAMWSLRAEIKAANDRVHIPFDPARQSLLLVGDQSGGSFVDNYALPVIYTANANDIGVKHRATRMVDRILCDDVRGNPTMSAAGIYTFGFHDAGKTIQDSRFETRFCELSQPEDPVLPAVTATVVELPPHRYRGLPVRETRTTVTTPDGNSYSLRGGSAAPLSWFPKPVIGCALNSGQPAWECFAQFSRNGFTPLAVTGSRFGADVAVLANALGLRHVAPADRRAADSGPVRAAANAARDAVVAGETAKLDTALADISAQIGSVPFNSLRGRMDIILPRLDRIVAAVERGVAARDNGRNNAQQMFHLIEQAPADAGGPYRARIDALKRQDPWFSFDPKTA